MDDFHFSIVSLIFFLLFDFHCSFSVSYKILTNHFFIFCFDYDSLGRRDLF